MKTASPSNNFQTILLLDNSEKHQTPPPPPHPRLDRCLSFLFTSKVHLFSSFKKSRREEKKVRKGRKSIDFTLKS